MCVYSSAAMTWLSSMSHMQLYVMIGHDLKGTILNFGSFKFTKAQIHKKASLI